MPSATPRHKTGSVSGSTNLRVSALPTGMSSGSVPRSNRTRAGGAAAARAEAARRAMEARPEGDTAIHILDNGLNRTPLPLQQRHSLLGGRAGDYYHRQQRGGGDKRESTSTTSGVGSSFFHSSFLMSSDGQSESGISGYLQSSVRRGGGRRKTSGLTSMDSSMASLSIAGDSGSHSQLPMGVSDRSESIIDVSGRGGGGGGGAEGFANTAAQQQQQLQQAVESILESAAYTRPAALSEVERRAWLRAQTTVRLAETPTIALFSHQDEAVSNESPHLVEDTQVRNEMYAAVVERHRVDEGTRYQERGTATFVPAKKSIHSEVRPPAKVDAGALQVNPWMLRDALAPLADDADDDADDAATAAAAGGAARDGKNGNGAGGAGDEADVELVGDVDGADGADGEESSSAAVDDGSGSGHRGSSSTEAGTVRGPFGIDDAGRQWMLLESLMPNLRIMERAVVQNLLERTQLAYRGVHMTPEAARITNKKAGAGDAGPAVTESRIRAAAAAATAAASMTVLDVQVGSATTPTATTTTSGAANGADAATNVDGAAGTLMVAGGAADAGTAAVDVPSVRADLPAMTVSEGVHALWRYHCPQTRGRAVTCMTWNRREASILAVGYSRCSADMAAEDGGADSSDGTSVNRAAAKNANATMSNINRGAPSTRGMVCCWSLKNPLAPELVLHLQADASVSALAFSADHPSLLAVGDTEGGIVVFDIQKDLATPSIVPAGSTGLHTGAVWDLRWVTSGKERGEFLMSISADGRIVQWAVGKTVERVAPDLMHLKRQPGAQVGSVFVEGVAAAEEAAAAAAAARRGGGKSRAAGAAARATAAAAAASGSGAGTKEDAVLSRKSGGMCFDVCPADHAIYIVGTEDGAVCQYNKSQTETYDLEYAPHTDLVYRVRWSPFSARYFLTCSADWTTRLYCLGQAKPLVVFDSPHQDAVQDMAWSNCNALSFATATSQGHVELWSVGKTIHPRATVRYEDGRRLNCLLFAEQETPVVVVGDDKGDVTVFLLKNSIFGRQDLTDDEQEWWLDEAVGKGA